MLIKLHDELINNKKITLNKYANGVDASLFGAFPRSANITFELNIPREFGICKVELLISPDGGWDAALPFVYTDTSLGDDIYRLDLDLNTLCEKEQSGLFYYSLCFSLGNRKYFSTTANNLDILLTQNSNDVCKFKLLIYEDSFSVPDWFSGGTMYHVFVDRFNKGSFEPPMRSDAVINPDWENGIPQFAAYPGGFVENNMFFGGNLYGICEKLDFLSDLGVTVIYLSPIVKAYSNHKYDTGDYMTVDEMFGGEKALRKLISEASKVGIKIIIDGVFNHVGDDSLYFNKYGKYDSMGAYQSPSSPYSSWFDFKEFPNQYECWWGIPILPKLNLNNPECRNFLAGKDSVVEKYIKMGVSGIRLDVADELTDEFLELLRETARNSSGDMKPIIIGEVWENAADKIAYGKRRKYFRGKQLDSVMNYPLKNAIIEYILRGNAEFLANTMTELYATYPKAVSDSLMNILGTHDTERILTVLGEENREGLSNAQLSTARLSKENREKAIERQKLASVIQFTAYGVPSVYYGDEAGLEGAHDPFCRMPYPWGREEMELISHYKKLGEIRKNSKALSYGIFKILHSKEGFICYERRTEDECLYIAVNCGWNEFTVDIGGLNLLDNKKFDGKIKPFSAYIIKGK